jgi:hypothetical protein
MKKYVMFFLVLLLAFQALAQDLSPILKTADETWRLEELKEGHSFISPRAIAGNPYLEKQFRTGKIMGNTTVQFPKIPLRYNVYTDQIEYRDKNGKIYALQGYDKVKAYRIGDTTFVYLPFYKKKGKTDSGYFQELDSGACVSGYVRYSVYLLPAVPEKPYQPAKPERFSSITRTFYIKKDDQPAQAVNNTKAFLQQFPQQKKQLVRYIKSEKIHLQKQPDFLKLLRYTRSLLSCK